MPSVNALQREYEARGLTVLLIDIREPRDLVARTVAQRGYGWRTVLDGDGRVSDAYGVRGTPTTFLVGRDGAVLGRAIGPRPWTGPAGRALFEALLGGSGPATP